MNLYPYDDDFFNATMTYRESSTFWLPYNSFSEMQLASANNPLYGADTRSLDGEFSPLEHFLKFSKDLISEKIILHESGDLLGVASIVSNCGHANSTQFREFTIRRLAQEIVWPNKQKFSKKCYFVIHFLFTTFYVDFSSIFSKTCLIQQKQLSCSVLVQIY